MSSPFTFSDRAHVCGLFDKHTHKRKTRVENARLFLRIWFSELIQESVQTHTYKHSNGESAPAAMVEKTFAQRAYMLMLWPVHVNMRLDLRER